MRQSVEINVTDVTIELWIHCESNGQIKHNLIPLAPYTPIRLILEKNHKSDIEIKFLYQCLSIFTVEIFENDNNDWKRIKSEHHENLT